MESPEVKALHKECVVRLKELIAQANRTCALLESITEFPITWDMWQGAMDQRICENNAQARYQEARESLFAAIRPQQRR
jgi:hypothetical protein